MKQFPIKLIFSFLLVLVSTELVYASFSPVDTIRTKEKAVYLLVLGTVQDAGAPQLLCRKSCCKDLFTHPDPLRKVVSLGVFNTHNGKQYIFDATPDFVSQVYHLNRFSGSYKLPDAIFLTHAHIGHYTGLMYLGKEALNSKNAAVYTMSRMKNFLKTNGPWSQLVKLQNVVLHDLVNEEEITLDSDLKVTPILVPHRDEYSETVGFIIKGPHKKVLFIPDIDKWEKWDKDIVMEIKKVDYAFLDATFFDAAEVNNRDISQIPHPFVIESMEKFRGLSPADKQKIYFIHFNHTNPLLDPESKATEKVFGSWF